MTKKYIPKPIKHQDGFTIVELMIATIVFSVVLMLVTVGLLQVSRTYYKGVTTSKTQQTARAIIDQISQSIQFSGGDVSGTPVTPPAAGVPAAFCINSTRYSYQLDRQLSDSPSAAYQAKHVLVSDTYSSCPGSNVAVALNNVALDLTTLTSARELMPVNLRLNKLEVYADGTNSSLWHINITVVAGEDDLLNGAHDQCASFRFGTQFCAVSTLSTVVQKRLK